jgi:hypothetical protein
VLVRVPALVVALFPKWQVWPVFIFKIHPAAPFPATPKTEPSATVAGMFTVVWDALDMMYPLFTTAVWDVPETSFHTMEPTPVLDMVTAPLAELMLIPVPAVNVAADGSLAVVPIGIWPAPSKTPVWLFAAWLKTMLWAAILGDALLIELLVVILNCP